MSTCQIEVMEFGQDIDRAWVRCRQAGGIVVMTQTDCLCGCRCPTCETEVSTVDANSPNFATDSENVHRPAV